MEVWNLPEPHLSSLLSPLPPDRTAPFSAPLAPKGLGPEHTWELGRGYDTVPLWTADPRGSSEGHRGLRVGSPPNHHLPVPSRDAASISFPLITRSSIPPGEGLRDKVTNSSGRPTKYAVPALPVSQVFSPHSLSPEPA